MYQIKYQVSNSGMSLFFKISHYDKKWEIKLCISD